MVKATFEIPEKENRTLNIIKGQLGFKNREQALIFILQNFEENLEPEVRPEYIRKLEKIRRGKFHSFADKKGFLNFLSDEV